MNKILRHMTLLAGLIFLALFCVGATASIASAPAMARQAFSEPINMLLIGFGLIAFGNLIKKTTLR